MRNKKREQLLIRVITLLDDAELGELRETILHLLRSARQASRARGFRCCSCPENTLYTHPARCGFATVRSLITPKHRHCGPHLFHPVSS